MLQIPVDKKIAHDFKLVAESTGKKQGQVFEDIFTFFMVFCIGKGNENGKENN